MISLQRLAVITFALAAAAAAQAEAQDCSSAASDRSAVKVEYETSGAAVGIPSAILFTRSRDGTLRAADVATSAELWTFRAPEAESAVTAGERVTNLTVLRFDANNDGTIAPRDGDRVWLYFGLKQAGPVYYALDVTDRTPRILWRADSATMPGLGDAWSTPTITRVRIGGTRQNGEHFVVIVGGGLQHSDDPVDQAGSGTHGGNALYMLDAASGRLLWSARAGTGAGAGASASFVSPLMTEAFAARVVAIDFDGDQFADRLYAADVGARVWRFDVWNGRMADQLVTGGVLASLGAVEPLAASATTPADARRFFNAPDVAYIRQRGEAPYYNLSIGSGNAETQRSAGVQERFYWLRDYAPFKRLTQAEYDSMPPIFDRELAQAGAVGAKGWKLDLPAGEQVLSESITLNGITLFTTFRPSSSTELCEASGTNRVYVVKVESPKPAWDLDADGQVTENDVAKTLDEQGPMAGTPSIELVWPAAATNPGDEPPPTPEASDPARDSPTNTRCRIGTEVLRHCVPLQTVVRLFWKRTTIN